jgi:ABC-type transport system involved in multi-copper enzyme maturation permease subunit
LSPPVNRSGFGASKILAMLILLGFWIVIKLT